MASEPRWIDSHCHLDPKFDQGSLTTAFAYAREAVVEAREAGVQRLINVGTSYSTSSIALAVAKEHPGVVWSTVGVHPHEAGSAIGPEALNRLAPLEGMLDDPRIVAIGECGLDYHYDHSPRDQQRQVFAAQIALANRGALALVIHSREAWDDTFDVLDAEGVPDRTVFHCFTGGPGEARKALDLGAHLSFSGIVTFASAQDVRDAAAMCPIERILVETDSPYLAPVPHRGQPNRPALVPLVGEAVAAARGMSPAAVAAATWTNAARVFGLPADPPA